MKLDLPLLPATLIRRYKRFLADVELADGTELTVHCPNPGAMRTCCEAGRPVWISDSGNPRRKLRHTLEMIRMGRTWVGVNAVRPNRVVENLLRSGRIPELGDYRVLRHEVGLPERRSRIDFLLEDPGRPSCWIEVKNATYKVGKSAVFPDAVTERGRRHLEELAERVKGGERGVIFFFVGRADCRRLRPADEIDPAYGEALRAAVAAGVEPLAYRFRFSRERVELLDRLPVDL